MRVWLTFSVITFSSHCIYSQNYNLTKVGSEILDSVYNSYVSKLQVPGLAVGILLHDSVLYSKGFGVTNLNSKIPVTKQSVFHLASVSKAFVATAIMQLAGQGKIALDSPLVKYLPNFKLNSEGYRDITIRQMLSHTSGLPDVQDYDWDTPRYDDRALESYVLSLQTKELAFHPGEDFGYSNMAYNILGEVISKVSGVTFEEYMTINILLPGKMFSSSFLNVSIIPELTTYPHIRGHRRIEVSEIYPYNRCHAPSSTLRSSLSDMLKWAAILANGSNQILSQRRLEQMTTSHYEVNPFTFAGLGWFIHEDNEIRYIFHTGRDVGFSSMFVYFPKQCMSIVVLSNCDFVNVMHAASTAFRVLQQMPPLSSFDDLLFLR